jgi:TPR repeat protein
MRFRIRLAGAFSVFALVVAVAAQAPAPTQGDDLPSICQQAAAGNAQAEFALGNRYFRGVDVAQDYAQALFWYRKSADQGFAPAQNQLGSMYQHKWGVPFDYKRET